MNNKTIGFALTSIFAAVSLSSCSGEKANVSREQVNDSLKNAGAIFHTAVEKTSESMKQLGPRLDAAKKTAAPQLDNAEQQVKNVGGDLGRVGLQFGNAIDSSAKAIKQGISQPASKTSAHHPN